MAPCLYRYTNNGVYYAVLRRSGKLIRKSLEIDRLEIAKRKLRDFLADLEDAAPDAHKVRFDEFIEDFLNGRPGAPKTLKRYRQIADHINTNWPGGIRQPFRAVDHSQCTRWLSHWNWKVPEVLRSVSRNASGAQRHDGLAALKSLDLASFIHTKHQRVLRRAHVETFHAALLEPLAQGADGVGAQSHFSGNALIAFALVHGQQRPCSFGFRSWRVTLSTQAFQELTLTCLRLDLHNWTTTKRHAQFLLPHTIYVDNLHDMTLAPRSKKFSFLEFEDQPFDYIARLHVIETAQERDPQRPGRHLLFTSGAFANTSRAITLFTVLTIRVGL